MFSCVFNYFWYFLFIFSRTIQLYMQVVVDLLTTGFDLQAEETVWCQIFFRLIIVDNLGL